MQINRLKIQSQNFSYLKHFILNKREMTKFIFTKYALNSYLNLFTISENVVECFSGETYTGQHRNTTS